MNKIRATLQKILQMLKMPDPSKLGPGEADEGPPWIWPQILFQEWDLSDLGSPSFTPAPTPQSPHLNKRKDIKALATPRRTR